MTTKLSWAVTAGDQIGDSEDDQPCGDHFIDKDLECHDGDAHRPTPGKNPYYQGDRKGPEDKSKTPDRKGGKNQPGHERDRSEHTQQNRTRMLKLLDEGHTPESLGREEVNHFADMMEENYGRPLTDKDVHTLVDMVNQKMGESFSQDPAQKGIHDPTAPKGFKGPKGREMSRPDSYHEETTDDAYTPGPGGGPEEGGLYDHYKNILKNRIKGGGEDAPKNSSIPEGPSQEEKNEQEQWSGPGYQGEDAGPEPEREKGEPGPYEYQDRHVDEWDPDASPEETKDYQKKERRRQTSKDYKRKRDAGKAKVPKAKSKKKAKSSLASKLIWANPMDVAEGRPCGDGEDPKKGKCNDGLAPPPKQQKPADQYGVSDKIKGPRQEGIGIEPRTDQSREARMAQHVDFLSQDDGMNTKQTTNLMRNMMGGAAPQPQPDGTSLVGSPAATPQEAQQQNDDYRDTLSKTGWDNRSDMGSKSVFTKGNTAIVLEKKPNGNQMKIKNLRNNVSLFPQRGRR